MNKIYTKFNIIMTPVIVITLMLSLHIYKNYSETAAAEMIADGLSNSILTISRSTVSKNNFKNRKLKEIAWSFAGSGLEEILVYDEDGNILTGTTKEKADQVELKNVNNSYSKHERKYVIRRINQFDSNSEPEVNSKGVGRNNNLAIDGGFIVFIFSESETAANQEAELLITKALIIFIITFLLLVNLYVNQKVIILNLIGKLINTNKEKKISQAYNRELEAVIDEIKTKKSNESSDRKILTNFLVNICHDIKTPINVLISEVQLSNLSNPTIESAEKQLNLLIEDLASASRITSGDFKFTKENFYWPNAVSESINLSKSALSFSRNNKNTCEFISLTSAKYPEYIESDERRIRQMISNLINNAIKYSRSCTIITHSNLIKINKQYYLECNVIDYGLGIRKSIQRDVFSAFTQANDIKPLMETGHGLGLSIIKTFTEKMNGSVHMHSNNPSGLRVGFRIPINATETREIKHRTTNKQQGSTVAIISRCPELAYAISDKLYLCKTIHHLSLEDLKKDTSIKSRVKYAILAQDALDDTQDMEHTELHNLSNSITIYGPTERSRELMNGWKKYSFELLSFLNSDWSNPKGTAAKRILVVEDISTNLAQYRNLCKNLDYSLIACFDANQAMLMLNTQKFDLVLIDILLDEEEAMDYGYDISLHAKFTINNETPFIAVTGTAFNEIKGFYTRNNINATITKAKGITENEKDIINDVIENPTKIYGEMPYFESELSEKELNTLKLLSNSYEPKEIYDCIKSLSESTECKFTIMCTNQVSRYIEKSDYTHLIEQCAKNTLSYFRYKSA